MAVRTFRSIWVLIYWIMALVWTGIERSVMNTWGRRGLCLAIARIASLASIATQAESSMRVRSVPPLSTYVERGRVPRNDQQCVWTLEKAQNTAKCASGSREMRAQQDSGRRSVDHLAWAAPFAKSIFVKVAGIRDTICILISSLFIIQQVFFNCHLPRLSLFISSTILHGVLRIK